MVMQLSVVGALMVGAIAYMVTSQNKFNLRSLRTERALWVAETGAQRFLAGFKDRNDCMDNPTNTSCTGYWLDTWVPVHDETAKTIGEYRVSLMDIDGVAPAAQGSKKRRIKVEGKVYDSKVGSTEVNMAKRVIGVQYEKMTLDNFAIASNHQLGGSRINGGLRVYGGVFTAGRLGLDSSSTGVYNDYHDLDDSQNFQGYPIPAIPPTGEVYVYKDNVTNPPPNPNGGIELSSQADLGTNTARFKAIHTDASVVDPGVGSPVDAATVGDSVVGNGQDTQVYADKRDHDLPDVNFPDASANSTFMQARLADATANGCVRGSSGAPLDLVLGTTSISGGTFAAGCSNFSYTVTGSGGSQTRVININGPVFIWGSISASASVTYTGKGAIFATGNSSFTESLTPANPTDYPNNAALGMVCSGNMTLGQGSGSGTHYAGSFFGNQSVTITKAKIFGNVFGGTIELPDGATRPDIYVHPEVRDKVGVPMPDFTNVRINKTNWWEMHSDAAK
ncbi:MAG: hypothetical protein AB7I41_22015 [Candidatus Sericytochromatia bacterium]